MLCDSCADRIFDDEAKTTFYGDEDITLCSDCTFIAEHTVEELLMTKNRVNELLGE